MGEAAARIRTPDFEHVLADDALAVIVSPDSGAVSLSLDSIAKVFAGKITDWFDLGVSGGKITIYAMAPTSELQNIFTNLIMKPRGLALADQKERVEVAVRVERG